MTCLYKHSMTNYKDIKDKLCATWVHISLPKALVCVYLYAERERGHCVLAGFVPLLIINPFRFILSVTDKLSIMHILHHALHKSIVLSDESLSFSQLGIAV